MIRKKERMNRRDFLKRAGVFAAFSGFFSHSSLSASSVKNPNILLIMADDVGYECLGCNGGKSYHTPNLDQLAETGVRFTQCFSTPKCTPSRVKIMTGRYGFRTGQKWGYIPPNEITFGHILRSAGYKTALAGKWQLCLLKEKPNHIRKMGFDESCVFGWHEGPRYDQPFIYQNGNIRTDVKDRFGPDVYSEFLIDFIKRNKDNKFLAYYPMALAHEISNDLAAPPPTGPSGHYKSYKELVEYLDKVVGRIVKTLDRLHLREKTLILFAGDNGSPASFITKFERGEYIREPVFSKIDKKVIRGGKGKLTDSGTHVPLIANWRGTTLPGTVCIDLIDFSDFMPTLAELSGGQLPQNVTIDGKSFAPQILGKKGHPREWIYNEWRGKACVRTNRWKLYRSGELYDMTTDPREKSPVTSASDTEESKIARHELQIILNRLVP